jgi:hypothetical protein
VLTFSPSVDGYLKDLDARLSKINENEAYKQHFGDDLGTFLADIQGRLESFKRLVAVSACVNERKKPFEYGMNWHLERFEGAVKISFSN